MRNSYFLAEEDFIIKNYNKLTIKELQAGLEKISGKKRTQDSINSKIKKLKAKGLISGRKSKEVVNRALKQRRKNLTKDG